MTFPRAAAYAAVGGANSLNTGADRRRMTDGSEKQYSYAGHESRQREIPDCIRPSPGCLRPAVHGYRAKPAYRR
jgi:putative NADH-flavin reductase